MTKYNMGRERGYNDGYEIGHEHGYEDGYERGREACRMTDDNRKLLFDALDVLRATCGVTVDQIVLGVLDYAKKS